MANYSIFVQLYTGSHFFVQTAYQKIEITTWEECQEAVNNTTEFIKKIEIYNNFCKKYPYQFFIKDAYENSAQIYYEKAIKEDKVEAFEEVINKYPNTKSAQASLRKIYLIKYKIAESQNAIVAYQDYILKYPESFLISKAKKKLYELEFEKVSSLNSLEAYRSFTKNYPKSKFKEQIIKKIDDIALQDFSKIRKINTVDTYKKFIEKYPESSYVENSTNQIKKIVFPTVKIIRLNYLGPKYDFETEIKKKLESAGFKVVPKNSTDYDATFSVKCKAYSSGKNYILPYKEAKVEFSSPEIIDEMKLTVNLWHPEFGTLFKENFKGKSKIKILQTGVPFKEIQMSTIFSEIKKGQSLQKVEQSMLLSAKENLDYKYLEYHILGSLQNHRCVEPSINILLKMESTYYTDYYKYVKYLGEIGNSRAIEGLIAALFKIKNSMILKEIMETLSKIGEPAVRPILEKLKNKNLPHYFTIKALGNIGDQKAIGTLIEYLKDTNVKNRMYAANALGIIGNSKAIVPLTKALEDEDMSVRKSATLALARLNWFNIVDYTIKSSFKTVDKISILSRFKDSIAVNYIISTLSNSETEIRKKAVDALGNNKDNRSINSLIKTLRDDDKDIAKKAARTLIQMKHVITNDHIELIIEEFIIAIEKETYKYVFYTVFEEISETINPPLLINLLNHPNSEVRISAAYLLGKLKVMLALNPLIQKLNATDAKDRKAAINALAKINDPRACMPLIAAINDEDYYTRRAVIDSWGDMKDPRTVWPLIQLLEQDKRLAEDAAWTLGEINDTRAVDALINYVNGPRSYTHNSREYAVKSLQQIGDERAINLFIELLNNSLSNPRLCKYAAQGLRELGNKMAVKELIEMLSSHEYVLARIAALSLGKIGDTTAVPALINALNSKHLQVDAFKALSMIKDKRAITSLINAFISMIKDKIAITPLIKELKKSDSGIGANALIVFKDPKVIEAIANCLEGGSYIKRKDAISALGEIGDFNAVLPLVQLLQNEKNWINDEILLAITTSLKEISDPKAIESLKLILKNSGLPV